MVNTNIGNIDGRIRLTLGVLALILVFIGPLATGTWRQLATGTFAVFLLATGSFRFCPIYQLLDINTGSKDS